MRLNKFLAQAGVASRRGADELIRQGAVKVNGQTVRELGVSVDPERDTVEVSGARVVLPARHRYVILNKPRGYLTTLRDTHGRPTVLDLVKGEGRLYPVGRLDFESRGLVLLTDDGELANRLTHPRFGQPKTYRARVKGSPTAEAVQRLREGVVLEDGVSAPAVVRVRAHGKTGTKLEITISEGRKRQVRRMCGAVGYPVLDLRRIRLGPLALGMLPEGAWRRLTAREAANLRAGVGLKGKGG